MDKAEARQMVVRADEEAARVNGAVVRKDGWPGRLICPPGTPMDEWTCVLPPMSDRERLALCVNASLRTDFNLDKGAGEMEWELAGVIAGCQERDDPKNGRSQFSWLVLFDRQGRTLGSSSPYLAHDVAAIIDAFPDFRERPLLIGIRYRSSKDGERQYHVARVLGEVRLTQE